MALDYITCPHCGCRCEDDEYCAACGKLFHDDPIPTQNVALLRLLGNAVRSVLKTNDRRPVILDNIEDDPDFDPSYAFFSSNIYNDER